MSIVSFIAGSLCGILSGLGIGGGSLLIIYLQNFASFPQLTAQLINLLYFIPSAFFAVIVHIKNKLVESKIFLPAVLTGIVFASLFSLIAMNIHPNILRKIFGFLVIYIGFRELYLCSK